VVCCPHCAQFTETSMRCLTPEVCAAVMAASLSFFACLQGLQRFGSFFNPLSWKNACSPEVQMKFSLQSTHLIVRSGCSGFSGSLVVSNSRISSPSDMMSSPWVDRSACRWRGHSKAVLPFFKKEPLFFLASIGVSVGCPPNRRSGCGKVITMAKLCQGKTGLSREQIETIERA